ncbi:hypothetical protein RJ639_034240 [Escallonia herrerae]|uniref:Transcription repressor n=1 Tax=Escallonia herrerae TaxID=1293975 RepID=A0AA88WTL8_9ASTE|nr:hypothetical protein RJ639_034240 [Escallonia herrerae]
MAKRFKFRISRVISSFHSTCRSKEPSTLPNHPVPPFFRLSPLNPKLIAVDLPSLNPPPSKHHQPHRSSFKFHVSSAFGCGTGPKSPSENEQEFQWEKEEQWHVVAKVYDETPRRKIYNSSVSGCSDNDEVFALPSCLEASTAIPVAEIKKRRGKKKKKKRTTPSRFRPSTSSDSGLFTDDEETETLVSSSKSVSTESLNNEMNLTRKKRASKRGVSRRKVECEESPARLSVFKKLVPSWASVEGKVKESFAVVKRSSDPYEDFKKSMVEMILEKEMFEERDLEELLQCFLSLNSRVHHGVIVEAFSEIWTAMFCDNTAASSGRRRLARAL